MKLSHEFHVFIIIKHLKSSPEVFTFEENLNLHESQML